MVNDNGKSRILEFLGRGFRIESLLVVGAVLLMLSPFLGWLDRPIRGWLTGLHMPLAENLPPGLSYGLFSFSAGLMALLAVVKRLRWVSALAGAAALGLSLHFLLAYSVINAKEIIAINELNHQEERIIAFNKKNLPMTFMVNPTFDPTITTDTIKSRLYATIHFSTFGWYASLLGSVFIIMAFCRSKVGIKGKIIAFILFVTLMVWYVSNLVWAPILAEYHRDGGDYLVGSGMYHSAIDSYELAVRMDKNVNFMRSYHSNIGRAYYFIGRTDTADYHIYKGNMAMAVDDYRYAIFCYHNAIINSHNEGNVVKNSFLAWAYIKCGLYEYDNGMVNSAVESWKKALATSPLQIESYYYLCRAYYDLNSYDESVMAGLQFLKLCGNKIRGADTSSNIGDSYYRMKRYDLAREFYLKSLKLVMNGNQRALMNLVGVGR